MSRIMCACVVIPFGQPNPKASSIEQPDSANP